MIKGVFFDMDGTITRPNIDWKVLRERIGVPDSTPIMAHIDGLTKRQQLDAHAVVKEMEYTAAETAVLNPGATELIGRLRAVPVPLALITNNHREAMYHIVEQFGLHFDLLLSREDAPLKPAPDLLLLALRRFNLNAGQTCFVGDGRYDRQASSAAGVAYIHLAHDVDEPHLGPTIYALSELWAHLPFR